MHDLLIILKNVSIHDEQCGRRELRPGAIINASEETAARLIAKGYARHVVPPAPLFVTSTTPPKKPKKEKTTHGNLNELNRHAGEHEDVSRDHVDNG